MTSQNIDISSWDILYMFALAYGADVRNTLNFVMAYFERYLSKLFKIKL